MKEPRRLEALGARREGRCSCPTNEQEKVASMEVLPDGDRIAIRLQARPDTTLDTAEIAACLDCTVDKSRR